jgi:hypothetical protein
MDGQEANLVWAGVQQRVSLGEQLVLHAGAGNTALLRDQGVLQCAKCWYSG